MKNTPLVTIWCPAYNQEKYIRESLDGFVNQQTNFSVEILVHDDASSDNTPNIIREYEKKHQNLRGIYQTENQLSKDPNFLTNTFIREAKGKYIAICEGDDYWTDPLKLQKQVDFLEAHPTITILGHSVHIKKNGKIVEERKVMEGELTFDNFLQKINLYTTSIIFKNILTKVPEDFAKYPAVDFYIKLLLLDKGNGYLSKESMAVYRVHDKGFWSSKKEILIHKKVIKAFRLMRRSFPHKRKQVAYATVKYKQKHKLFTKDVSAYIVYDFIELCKIGLKKIKKQIGL